MGTDDLGYRPELDGIRGVAILLVVGFHLPVAGFHAAPGGWVGVDVFFVVSGFLITRLLLEEHRRSSTVDLRAFYRRRALRLVPALLVVTAVTPAVLWMLGDDSLDETVRSIPAALLYVMNWQEAAGRPGGLLSMTWSLAIEEQFYLLWPPLLTLLLRRGRRRAAVTISCSLVVYAWIARPLFLYGSDFLSNRAYFATDTRADGLMLGCLAALLLPVLQERARAVGLATPAATVLVLVVSLAALPAGFVLVGVLGLLNLAAATCVVCVVVDRRSWLATTLRWRPLVEVGRRSYGIYLWHGLTILVGRTLLPDAPLAQAALVLTTTALVVQLSWRFVERPFLDRRRPSTSVADGTAVSVPTIATAAQSVPASRM